MTVPIDFTTAQTQWLTHLEAQGRSPHTRAAYRRALAHFVRWYEAAYNMPPVLSDLLPRDLADWQAHQQTVEKARPATINQRLTALSRFLAWANAQGYLAGSPAAGLSGIRPEARQPKSLSNNDLRRFLRAVYRGGSPRDIAMVELLAGAGLRVGELLALRVGDVTLGERSGQVVVRRGKHRGYRTVPLTASVRKALAAWLAVRPQADDADAPLWWGQRGPLTDRSAVNRMLAKYARRAGVAPFGPHALRHTFATRYLAANPGDLRGLAALLGHSNLNTVMIYTEPRLEDLAQRMERVE
jgi:integrase/recombinase XerC